MGQANTISSSGYNLSYQRQLRFKRYQRNFIRFLVAIVILFIGGTFFADYLARLPRERFAKNYSYLDRVKLGAKKIFFGSFLWISADNDNGKSTKLPIVELYMKGNRLDKLTENLPDSGDTYQKADLRIGGKDFKVEARLKGDSINHWAFPQKSWRVRFRKDKDYDDMRYLNLNVPRVDNQISNWLGYRMAEIMGGPLVPSVDYVHFRLNRKYDGVRLLLEQPNQDFLRRRNLEQGKIYVGDIDSTQIYGGVKRKKIYKDLSGWDVRVPTVEDTPSEMEELLRIIREEVTPYRFFYQMEELLDIEATLKYIALLELVSSVHIDETHNGKFYFNPVNGKFSPIAWDTVAYFWKNRHEADIAVNSLFRVLLSNPEFRERKDEYLWEAIHGDLSVKKLHRLINQQAEAIRPDIYSFALKLHANDKGIRHISNSGWEKTIKDLKGIVEERHSTLASRIRESSALYRMETQKSSGRDAKYRLGMEVRSPIGLRVDKIALQLDPPQKGIKVSLKRRGLEDLIKDTDPTVGTLSGITDENGVVEFSLKDRLYSKRKYERRKVPNVVPATYVYELSTRARASVLKVKEITAYNGISGEPYEIPESTDLRIEDTHRKNIVWWSPEKFLQRKVRKLSGTVTINEDLILDKYEDLEIAPGTTVKMGDGSSIILRGGKLTAQGTRNEPIKIVPASSNADWGVIGIVGGEALFRFITIEGGTEEHSQFVRFGNSVSFHDSEGTIARSKFVNGSVGARGSDLTVKNTTYDSIFDELVSSTYSSVVTDNVQKVGRAPAHIESLLSDEGHGTPKRTEREFKFSLKGKKLENWDLNDLAEEIQKGFKKALKDPSIWAAPDFTGNNYYRDKAVKDFVFRDVYVDTEDSLNYKHAISYRYRNRYTGMGSYKYHLKHPLWSDHWPYRLEFQAKTNRQEVEGGFSTVDETRFEFRKESLPFSQDNLPPSAPWDLAEFLPYFLEGEYKRYTTLPAQDVISYLKGKGEEVSSLQFSPTVVLLTERFRQHLNMKSDWGSGPNPEQAYIISLDRSKVYGGEEYVEFLNDRKLGIKGAKTPPKLGELVEIEVEFERNVSDKLDQELNAAEEAGEQELAASLKGARDAFLKDQQEIMQVVKRHLAKEGIEVVPANKSKYVQAYELL